MADYFKHATTVPVGRVFLDECGDLRGTLNRQLADLLTYGQPRTHRNPMPTFVLFPRVQAAINGASRFKGRVDDAISAFRYGIPDCDD